MKRLLTVIYALLCVPAIAQTAPTVSIAVTTGNTPKIDWACQATATAATATAVPVDPLWSGSLALTGSKAVTPITASAAYTVTCTITGKTTLPIKWSAVTQNTDGSALTDLSGYEILSGTDPNNLTLLKAVAANVLQYDVTGLSPGTYYFAIRSVTTANLRSVNSAVANGTATAAQTASAASKLTVPAAVTGVTVN